MASLVPNETSGAQIQRQEDSIHTLKAPDDFKAACFPNHECKAWQVQPIYACFRRGSWLVVCGLDNSEMMNVIDPVECRRPRTGSPVPSNRPPSNGVGPTDHERIPLWPLGTSKTHEFTGVELGTPKST
ncbi:hypothetical protein KSP40_PGU000579 [Platanthera guangdongensis]|uniref:Uncharacterized protein n=1 Tax=Platanthera guangdongensis TaxID=2320717 RepID=A0ABR2MFK5_9ASPA